MEVHPHKLVFGGEALAHTEGRTLLVSYAAPGDRLEVEVTRESKGVIHARPMRILDPAPERVEPPCPYFGRCGGCHYQHLDSQTQLHWKAEIVRETLTRIGHIEWHGKIPTHSAMPWGYRNQAEIKMVRNAEGRVELGFFAAESHRLIPVDACMILSPRLNVVLERLREAKWSSRLEWASAVAMRADDRDEHATLNLQGLSCDSAEACTLAEDLLAAIPGLRGVTFETRTWRRAFGDPWVLYRVLDFSLRVSQGSFFQASRFLLDDLVKAAVGDSRGGLALDLYAGVGLFTLPLARQFEQVLAVESNPESIADLDANLRSHGIENVHVVEGRVAHFVRRYAMRPPEFVLLDPPRTGVGAPTVARLARLRPRTIHYVSCHPPTAARDLAALIAGGYQLDAVEIFDLFPQTYHVESLYRLSSGLQASR